jgi:hypothetical protein
MPASVMGAKVAPVGACLACIMLIGTTEDKLKP